MQRRQIRQRVNLFSAAQPQHRAADQKQRQVATNFSRDPQLVLGEFGPSARSSPSIVATAFDDAAPMPPCTGNRFSISMTTCDGHFSPRPAPLVRPSWTCH